MNQPVILMSFDVEEFDIPLEYGENMEMDEQMRIGATGLDITMNLVGRSGTPSTFFTTANFASHFPNSIRSISREHEIASHTYYHSRFVKEDLASSKAALENITGREICGLRMPRMKAVTASDVADAGYRYDSSINPTWIPGRYNNLKQPRTLHQEERIIRLPSSVTPNFRIPLFWLSFKNFPYSFYVKWVERTLEKDGYVCLYFHPWEFADLSHCRVPTYIKRHSGRQLQHRFSQLLADLRQMGEFKRIDEYLVSRSKVRI